MKEQIELGLEQVAAPSKAKSSRRKRADWWFRQMRTVVDRAFDWPAAPSGQAVQQGQLLFLGK